MFEFLSKELSEIYGEDKKRLRTDSIFYGHLGEGRWHSTLQTPLTNESIIQFEKDLKKEFPPQYKKFLSTHNGCYLFDLLRIAGKRPDTYKGLSIEEQNGTPFPLDTMQNLYQRKRTPKTHFIFADSIVKNTYYVIDSDEKILEIDYRTKKIINSYEDLKIFIDEFIYEGKENLENGIFFEFE
ncbi:SMI1/KNR4 family protein [Bacillus sp. ISL-7]|uniref:SMI1/KNR4 family protein n=1 Tax=Bacillus sp. ISL-7 TaxID=2819136 RepID=UPI001BED23B3|nr:SMI1/KNR4 family protein [Bacillus sp. ISL-7]MBT2733506.1 SMI1/KNR4 family protein [Bacillus sp. ISL-7]